MMKRLLTACGLGVVVLCSATPSHAFKTGYHFYMTYAIGHWCGLQEKPSATGNFGDTNEAYAIAWGNASTDTFKETDAGANPDEWLDPSKAETRLIYHFAVPRGMYNQRVKRGSKDAWLTVEDSISNLAPASKDPLAPMLVGIGLHTLQDSWAHEGYSPEWGHWTQEPDFPSTNVGKSLEAAAATWDALNRWKLKKYGKGCDVAYKDLAGLLETWCQKPLNSGESVAQYWRKNLEALAQKPVPADKFDDNNAWAKHFLTAADAVKRLKELE